MFTVCSLRPRFAALVIEIGERQGEQTVDDRLEEVLSIFC